MTWLAEEFRQLKHRWRVRANLKELEQRTVTKAPHRLDAPLVVSLTSYPPRFGQLALTLRCLLKQTIAADAVILWLAEADMPALPDEIRALEREGLKLKTCPDLKSYKKLVPALQESPDRYIATADDDVYFGPDWLEGLVTSAQAQPGRVIAHRAHKISWAGDVIAPYAAWAKNISGAVEGPDIFGTGVGGILYPPGALHPMTTREDLFLDLCPSADDIWFYWMARLQGTLVRHVGPKTRVVEWHGSQDVSLRAANHGQDGAVGGNDQAIANLTKALGPPWGKL